MSSAPSRPVVDATVQHAAREAIPPKTVHHIKGASYVECPHARWVLIEGDPDTSVEPVCTVGSCRLEAQAWALREGHMASAAVPPLSSSFGAAWLSSHGASPSAPKKARRAWPEVLVVIDKEAPRRSFIERRIKQASLGGEKLSQEQLRTAKELGIAVPKIGKRVSWRWGANPPIAEVIHDFGRAAKPSR